ncbi:hypothetical protein MKX01_022733 [Papaver californicum]|nr:hypothetical protein MKX01_022733 [Papaver californicum]
MDQWKTKGFCQSVQGDLSVSDIHRFPPESSQRPEVEVKDSIAARKIQKADREKLRRDRLNEQFMELGNALDPDRPKNDKATILGDTIQMLKDLTAQVNKLKEEYTALSEESNELTEEKNELREEKASLKTDIDNLNMQYQQRIRVMFPPWSPMDPSVVMGPHPYSYRMPVPVPAGPIPMHPSLQPYPFFTNQNPGGIPNPCSTYLPFTPPPANPQMEQVSPQFVSPHNMLQPGSRSHVSSKQDSKSKSSDRQRGNNVQQSDGSNDVVTELELKTPGSTADQEVSCVEKKSKQSKLKDSGSGREESCSSRCSSRGLQDSSSNSVGDAPKADK